MRLTIARRISRRAHSFRPGPPIILPMRRTGRLMLVVILLLGLTWVQPAPAVRGAESPTEATLVGEEIGTSPELLPASDLPPPGQREIGYVNGRFLILNMHGALFTNSVRHFQENVDYAAWMNAGVIRVFGTDAGELVDGIAGIFDNRRLRRETALR